MSAFSLLPADPLSPALKSLLSTYASSLEQLLLLHFIHFEVSLVIHAAHLQETTKTFPRDDSQPGLQFIITWETDTWEADKILMLILVYDQLN